ncbi:MAG: FAD-dependent oxidoreductase [Actinomycetia bacterium]|nr:FAD-dependent oxidoreductase [Actinomycetes bacterium]
MLEPAWLAYTQPRQLGKAGSRPLVITSSWDTAGYLAWGPSLSTKGKTVGLNQRILRKALFFEGELNGRRTILIDGYKFQGYWRESLEGQVGIRIFQDTCEDVAREKSFWKVKTMWGKTYFGKTLIIATGTFLGGRVEIGSEEFSGGRPGEMGSARLEKALRVLGAEFYLTKEEAGSTIGADGIEWGKLGTVDEALGFCWTETRDKKRAYIEPIDRGGKEFYLRLPGGHNRKSAPLNLLPGLKKAQIVRPAYTVFYPVIGQDQLRDTQESKFAEGLFFAGRVSGAQGYAESALQGSRAGCGAAKKVSRET